MMEVVIASVFPGVMAFAGAMDLFTMTIPNRISIFLAVAFFIAAPLLGMVPYDIAMHTAAGALMLVIGFGMFARGWIGGGDAKVFAAASLWVGFEHLGAFVLAMALIGGILSLALLIFRKLPMPAALLRHNWFARLHGSDVGIPYGVAIAGAALTVYPSLSWLH